MTINGSQFIHTLDHLLSLPSFALITTGRTGSDFLQSLLDSHEQVLTFNGALFFNNFWRESVCVQFGNFKLEDLAAEFYGRHIEKFKSQYDFIERKDQLGDRRNESINIELEDFKRNFLQIMAGKSPSSKNVLLAIYGAYAVCLGQDIFKKRIFFHHIHHYDKLKDFLKDFPDTRIISMTRDPRANFVSGIINQRSIILRDNEAHLYHYIRRILHDSSVLKSLGKSYITVRIEDLDDVKILEALCGWLGIQFNENLLKSTWGGLKWWSDRTSRGLNTKQGFCKELLDNKWDQILPSKDKFILNLIFNKRLRSYGYDYKKVNFCHYMVAPILMVLPLKFETRFWSPQYLRLIKSEGHATKFLLRNFFYYFARAYLFIGFYLLHFFNRDYFKNPILRP